MPARKKSRRPATKSSRGKAASKKRKAAPKKAAKRAAKKPTPKRAKKPARRAASSTPRPKPAPSMPPAPPNGIGLVMHHIDYTTHDPGAVKRFYVDTLGFTESDLDPQFQYLFVRTGHTSSVGFMPPMEGMGEPSPAKEPTIYFIVADVDRAYASLAAKGVHFEGPPADMPWGHRVISTMDPEGRRVLLATPKPKNP
ncbi:MAG TPA: VOC family protein [Candidatus Eisenbacteria bacterium]|nr:VOC family protein [Candidatus Eisenbacteria bacterium]